MQINANILKKVSDFLVEISNGKWVLFSPAALISAVIHFIVSISNFLFSFRLLVYQFCLSQAITCKLTQHCVCFLLKN